jgi:branched-chain amino acid transport system substrate-binding protein
MRGQIERSLRNRVRCYALCVAAVVMLVAFTSVAVFAQKVETDKVGIIEPITGPLALIGEKNVKGYQLAVKKINAAGGIKALGGARIELLIGDSEGKPEVAMSVTERLINNGAVVLMGAYQSASVYSATQTAERFKTPFLVSCGVADNITERGFKYTFRFEAPASMLTRGFFDFLKEMGRVSGKPVKTIGLLYEDTLFGQSMSKTQKQVASELSYKIVADLTYPSKTSDVSPQISKLVQAKPDFVMATAYLNDAILITRTMYEMNLTPLGILGTGGFDQPDYIKETGKLGENIMVSAMWSHALKLPGVAAANAEFKKEYGFDMTGFVAMMYSATYVLKDALERAGSMDKEKLRNAIADTRLKAGSAGNLLHYDIWFDKKTGQDTDAYELTEQVQNGQFVPVWPANLAPGKPIYPFPGWKK